MVRIPRASVPPGSAPPASRAGRTVYRPVTVRLLLAGVAAIAAWGVVDLALRGRPGEALLAAVWTVAGLAALGCVFWRPAVVVDDAAVELRNVVRDVRVPWSRLEAVTTRYALTLYADGRRHASWAGAAPGRSPVARQLPDDRWNPDGANPPTSSRDLRADSGATAFLVEQGWRAWQQRHEGPAPGETCGVEVRWRPVLPGIALAAGLLATLLTPVLT